MRDSQAERQKMQRRPLCQVRTWNMGRGKLMTDSQSEEWMENEAEERDKGKGEIGSERKQRERDSKRETSPPCQECQQQEVMFWWHTEKEPVMGKCARRWMSLPYSSLHVSVLLTLLFLKRKEESDQ